MRFLSAAALTILSLNSYANVFQFFTGITYSNPAELFKVQQNEVIMGGTGFNLNGKFSGTSLNFNTLNQDRGISVTQDTNILPYGRIATRINKDWVFGVDVTQPYNSNLYWGRNVVTQYVSTENIITDIDVSPRLSFSPKPGFAIGGGLNFNFLKSNQNNWVLPTGPTTTARLINDSSSFGLGFNVGAFYAINKTNFLSATYYSSIRNQSRGESRFNGNISTDLVFNFRFPPTTIVSYVHLFSPDWLVNLQAYRTEWNVNQSARFFNTAALPPAPSNFLFPTHYKESWAYSAATRHQFNESLGLTLIGLVDYGPERDNLRTVTFPSDTIYFLALAADYHLTKTTSLELLYGHGFSQTIIDNQVVFNGTRPLTQGRVHINVDVVDLKLKIQM